MLKAKKEPYCVMLPPNGTLHIKQQKIYTKERIIRKYI